ncbi:hypothetical protein ACFL1S_07630 [Pseudomonadota bacterium]
MSSGPGIPGIVIGTVLGACLAMQVVADGTNMQQAHKAMEIARSYKGQGDLKKAEYMFQLVMKNSPPDSNIHREAEDELEYYVPLMRVQRLLWDGNAEAVEQELFALQQTFEDQPVRLQEINRILNGLRSSSTDDGGRRDNEVDEKLIMREATLKLDTYFRQHNRYPTSRTALTEALNLEAAPLDAFEIGRYSSRGTGYLLILRNKDDKSQTITMEKTGLLQ